MKQLLTVLILLLSISVFAQTDSTTVKKDSSKVKTKEWSIKLNDQQKAAISSFDMMAMQLQQQFELNYNSILKQKETYFQAIVENHEIDVLKIHDIKYEDGKLIFIEDKKPK